MSDVSAMSLAVLRRFSEFIEGLPEDQLADLAEGRARLSYVPWGATEPVAPKTAAKAAPRKPASKIDVTATLADLNSATTRDEGRAFLKGLKLADLRAIAEAAGIAGMGKAKQAELTEEIVALTIGGRMSFAAMRDL
jgi:hypothetical protein